MNPQSQNASTHNPITGALPADVSESAEATLRLIAQLPAPAGLEERVLSGLRSAPRSRRLLHWPAPVRLGAPWMRAAAAAAIVFVVAGGGWGIYTRVQPTGPAKVLAMPPHAGPAGGFSNAGAIRTPQTLNGPVVAQRVTAQPAPAKSLKKAPAQSAKTASHKSQAAAVTKDSSQPAVTVAK